MSFESGRLDGSLITLSLQLAILLRSGSDNGKPIREVLASIPTAAL